MTVENTSRARNSHPSQGGLRRLFTRGLAGAFPLLVAAACGDDGGTQPASAATATPTGTGSGDLPVPGTAAMVNPPGMTPGPVPGVPPTAVVPPAMNPVPAPDKPDPPFVPGPPTTAERGGKAWWFEAETVGAVAPWAVETATADYSGTGYLINTSPTVILNQGGEVAFEFEVTQAGKYVATIRGRRDQEGECAGEADDQCNDVRTAWDDQAWEKTMVKGTWGEWIWQSQVEVMKEFPPNAMDLAVGKHVLRLGVRSKGVKVDVITIHLEGEQRPAK